MDLKIRPFNAEVKQMYENHGHFHDGDAGLDLFVINEQTIGAGENAENRPYLVMSRSSIGKTPLRLANAVGLIDAGYRGEIMAVVDNIKTEDYTVEPGQRLFQLVAMDGSPIYFELVEELSDTTRGGGGFGSTGK